LAHDREDQDVAGVGLVRGAPIAEVALEILLLLLGEGVHVDVRANGPHDRGEVAAAVQLGVALLGLHAQPGLGAQRLVQPLHQLGRVGADLLER
jgi:hypothetical protein